MVNNRRNNAKILLKLTKKTLKFVVLVKGAPIVNHGHYGITVTNHRTAPTVKEMSASRLEGFNC